MVVGQAGHDLRGLDQRVVGAVGHRAVAGRALHAQPPPRHALLPHVHDDVRLAVVLADRAAVLGQEIIGAQGVPVLLAHVPGAERAAGFLVGARQVHERAARPPSPLGQRLQHDRLRRRDVQHVERASAPHLALHQLAAERIARPRGGVHRHHIGVAHQAQRRRRRIGALDAGHQAGAARGVVRLIDLDVEATALQVRLEHVAGLHLLAGGDGAVVHALVADELLQELDGLAGQRVVHDRGVWRVRKSLTRRIDSARCVGAAPILLDLEIGRQLRDLVAGGRRVRLVGPGLQQQGRRAAPHELAAHREDEVAAEHVVAELPDHVVGQARITGQHGLGEAAHRLIPCVTVLVQADGVLEYGGGYPLGSQLAERQAVRAADTAAHDVKRRWPRWSIRARWSPA